MTRVASGSRASSWGEMANLSSHHFGRKLAVFEFAGWIAGGYNRIRLLGQR